MNSTKQRIIRYSFLVINLIISVKECYSSSELMEPSEIRILETIEKIKKHHLFTIESQKIHIKTKSHKPDNIFSIQDDLPQHTISPIKIEKSSLKNKRVDGRKHIQATHAWPYSVHGTVFMTFPSTKPGTYIWGSGTLIAPNLVLTAAHNLYDNIKKEEVTKVRFCPAINGDTSPFGEPKVIKHYFPEGYKNSSEDDYSLDYGLLVLDQQIGEETGHFGLAVVSESHLKTQILNVTGYPGDKVIGKDRFYEMWTMGGPVKDVKNSLAHYEIDTYSGQGGGGVWYQEGKDYFVAGVHVGGDAISGLRYAVLLTQELYDQIVTWITDSILKTKYGLLRHHSFANIAKLSLYDKKIDNIGAHLLTSNWFSNLVILNLSRNNITDIIVMELAKNSTLTELCLSFNKIGVTGAAALSKNVTIKKLNLNENNIRAAGAKELAKNLTLKELLLAFNNIHSAGAKELSKNISIIKLCLVGNSIGPEGAKELAKNTTLTALNLSYNDVGTIGAKELAKNITLRTLDLRYNHIDDTGAKELAKTTTLKELHLEVNNISEEGVKPLLFNPYINVLTIGKQIKNIELPKIGVKDYTKTNQTNPRIEGRIVEWLHKDPDDLYVKINLNMKDPEAITANQRKSVPIMLSEVRRIDKSDTGMSPYAVLVDSGSHVEFAIKSKGPFGFGYRISTGAEMIAKELYQYKTEYSDEFSSSYLRRYQNVSKTIKVEDLKTMGVTDPAEKVKYMFCNVESWPIHDYVKDGKTYKPGPQRDSASVRACVIGAEVDQGVSSAAKFGSISNVNKLLSSHEKDAEGLPLKKSSLRLMFLVFANEQEKNAFYSSYQDIMTDDF